MSADPVRPPETDEEPWAIPDPDAERGGAVAWAIIALLVVAAFLLGRLTA